MSWTLQTRYLSSALRRKLGTGLALFGLALWMTAIVLHVTPADARDVTVPHIEARLLAIVTGGASVGGGIILIAAG
jgi:hypothetical protein